MIQYVSVVLLFFACTINVRGDSVHVHNMSYPIADIAIFIDNIPFGDGFFDASDKFATNRLEFVKTMVSALTFDSLVHAFKSSENPVEHQEVENDFKIGFAKVNGTFVNSGDELKYEEVAINRGHGREAMMVTLEKKEADVTRLLQGFVHNTTPGVDYAQRVLGIVKDIKIPGRRQDSSNYIPRLVIWISPHRANNIQSPIDEARKLFEQVKRTVDIVFLLASINGTDPELFRQYVAHNANANGGDTVAKETPKIFGSTWPDLQQTIKLLVNRCKHEPILDGMDTCKLVNSPNACHRKVRTKATSDPGNERYCFNFTNNVDCGLSQCVDILCKKATTTPKPNECDAACEQHGSMPVELVVGDTEWYQYCPKPSPASCTGPPCTTQPTTTTTTTQPAAKQPTGPFTLVGWQIAVIVIGATLVLTIIVVIVVYMCMRYRPCDKERRLRKKHVHGFQQAGPGGGGGGHAHGGPPHGARGGGDGGGRGGGGGGGGRGGDRDRDKDGGRDRGGDHRGGGTDRRRDDSRRGGPSSRR